MNTRIFVALVLVVALVVLLPCGGCVSSQPPQGSIPSATTPVAPTTPAVPTTPAPIPNKAISADSEPDKAVTWIRPAIVAIGHIRPGDMASYNLEVHNGQPVQATYDVTYRVADRAREGYIIAGPEYAKYVTVAPQPLILEPYETGSVSVVVSIPSNEIVAAPNWEFWISVMDAGATGLIRSELCCRWQIAMEQED